MPNSIKCVLLDVEGTTSSISFVYDEMFPYVRKSLDQFLADEWESAEVQDALQLLAKDCGFETTASWLGDRDSAMQREWVAKSVRKLMDDDVKATGLKQLQGLIWKNGFHSGALISHLFPDVASAIKKWVELGSQVRIYSSGSVGAQKLFFGHTVEGDLLPWLSGHYDTTTGPKREPESYLAIASDIGCEPQEVLFVSDVAAELDAAEKAGMQTALSIRPGNKPVENVAGYRAVESFAELF